MALYVIMSRPEFKELCVCVFPYPVPFLQQVLLPKFSVIVYFAIMKMKYVCPSSGYDWNVIVQLPDTTTTQSAAYNVALLLIARISGLHPSIFPDLATMAKLPYLV